MFPRTFSNQKEYDSYLSCKKKLQLGDDCLIFIFKELTPRVCRFAEEMNPNSLALVKVIAKSNRDVLLGSETPIIPFSKCSSRKDSHYHYIADITKYLYSYWLMDSDVRVAKIIKA